MLSTGIKNSILIVLIIFILHFLLKNVLLSKREHYSVCDGSTASKVSPPDVKSKDTPVLADVSENDTYDAWFGKEQVKDQSNDNDFADLDKYFNGELDIKKEVEKAASCPIPVKDASLPKSSTCDVNFEKLPVDVLKKDIKANCNLRQDKTVMIVNEYENESVLNGGKLFMNLDAYDNLDSMFAPL